ncbi:MAG: hypothetical protein ACI4R8_02080 [Candidatus Caccovivens sp.]
MNTNFDILNYLNLTNSRLGKLYKLTGYNPLPEGFVLTKKIIKDKLILNQLQCNKIPEFVFESKKELKTRFKNSVKNIKKIQKTTTNNLNPEFEQKIDLYLNVRREVTESVLKDFGKVNFDECDAYLEIYALDPIFAELLPDLFEENFSMPKLSRELEQKYEILKNERIKTLEKKITQKRKNAVIQEELVRSNINIAEKSNKKENKKKISKEKKSALTKLTKKTKQSNKEK